MQIRPTNTVQTTHNVNLNTQKSSMPQSSNSLPVDQLDISAEAQALSTQNAGDIRADRVADIKAQIARGDYETSEKLDAAVSRLLDEIA